MSKTKIEYGDRTWNPLTGCTVISEGCMHCWARTMAKRLKAMGRVEYQRAVDDKGHWTGEITLVPERLKEPSTWRKPQHVLVEYMGDLFHAGVPNEYILQVFDVMKKTPKHTYQLLTKRPDEMLKMLLSYEPLPNVILGVSIENQRRADERRMFMHTLSARGWRTWVSYEPALGPVDWTGWEFLNQLVCGGESGSGARPMHPDWARGARDFCQANRIKFFFKQWGEWGLDTPEEYSPRGIVSFRDGKWIEAISTNPNDQIMLKVGKKKAGRSLDGREWNEMP